MTLFTLSAGSYANSLCQEKEQDIQKEISYAEKHNNQRRIEGLILPVYDALSQSTQIRHILARHEQGAGFIAQGMARTEGKPAVC
ncbi:DUF1090 family protein, partial [Salmonella enterica subsp. enterica serovar Anatum]|nr:DUF1090 family protein [Salmonella enterica subsp. enterica serovar Anatum]